MNTEAIVEGAPKKKKAWLAILIFLPFYIIANFVGEELGKLLVQKERRISTTELQETYKKAHVEGCVKAGSTEGFCACTFDGLTEKLGLDGYKKMAMTLMGTDQVQDPSEIEKYTNIATEELIRCRQKTNE